MESKGSGRGLMHETGRLLFSYMLTVAKGLLYCQVKPDI